MCHLQFKPLSLTHTLLAKVSFHYSRVKQLLCSHVTHTVFPTRKATNGNCCNLPRLTVSVSPHLPLLKILAAIFPPVSPLSICIIDRAVGNQPLTVWSNGGCVLVCVILLLIIQLPFCLSFSCLGPDRVQRVH